MHKLQRLSIQWNYDIDANLTIVKSPDKVLETFFIMKDWEFVRNCFHDIYKEKEAEYEEKRACFKDDYVKLYVNEEETRMERSEFLKVFLHLYDLMITGANDDHHSVRYEPWWQEFTEVYYQLKCKIEIQEQLKKVDI
jgi:hypothetical protein